MVLANVNWVWTPLKLCVEFDGLRSLREGFVVPEDKSLHSEDTGFFTIYNSTFHLYCSSLLGDVFLSADVFMT